MFCKQNKFHGPDANVTVTTQVRSSSAGDLFLSTSSISIQGTTRHILRVCEDCRENVCDWSPKWEPLRMRLFIKKLLLFSLSCLTFERTRCRSATFASFPLHHFLLLCSLTQFASFSIRSTSHLQTPPSPTIGPHTFIHMGCSSNLSNLILLYFPQEQYLF